MKTGCIPLTSVKTERYLKTLKMIKMRSISVSPILSSVCGLLEELHSEGSCSHLQHFAGEFLSIMPLIVEVKFRFKSLKLDLAFWNITLAYSCFPRPVIFPLGNGARKPRIANHLPGQTNTGHLFTRHVFRKITGPHMN